MSTAIVYYSKHHGNTKKLLDAIAEKHPVTLIDVTAQPDADLSGYERIGFASGIYYSAFAKQIISFANAHLPERKDVFYIYTHGAPKGDFLKTIREIAEKKHCREIGEYRCQGFDTFGPFKLVGGIAKGHPTEEEVKGAVTFYQQL
ncbi:MAG: flavodoxin [Clostridia bacterium]|nr:flavodoxin [Clostridia bacterium]